MRGIGQLTCLQFFASTLVLAACGATRSDVARSGEMTGNAIVIGAYELALGRTNLVTTLQDHIPGMRVDRSGACPEIILRSRKSALGVNSPAIYVDGARAVDTCILDMLNPMDIERIEVYRNGVTGKPGYKVHPNGVILIFVRSGRG